MALRDFICSQNQYGVVLGDDQAMTDHFGRVMREGEGRFRTHFGREPTPYAVLVGDRVNPVSEGGVTGADARLQAELKAVGAQHVLPWFTAEQRGRLATAAARRGAEARARREGLTGDALASEVDRILETAPPIMASKDQDSAAAHELGHMWTVAAFWPDRAGRAGGHYGGPAADWFDESSAVLMEDEVMAAERRDSFRQQWSRSGGTRPKPLPDYFVDAHPLAGRDIRTSAGTPAAGAPPPGLRRQGGIIVRAEDLPPGAIIQRSEPSGEVSSPAPGQTFSISVASSAAFNSDAERDAASMFYSQARVLADFLFDRTRDPGVYGRIAAALARGETMEQWLSSSGPQLGLGATAAELEEQWRSWLTRTYGAIG
ncbi:MAG TPA: hypothetical protein VGB60_00910 [Brevundimonas sp.]|uniref:hypothetical protein n=1 Tax=Brevundimonas sp. TaxID=1871086 RepID=UPI002ED95BBE